MSSTRPSRPLLGLIALVLAGLAFAAATVSAGAAGHDRPTSTTPSSGSSCAARPPSATPPAPAAVCLELTDGQLPRHAGRHRRLHRRRQAQRRRGLPQRRRRRLRPDQRHDRARRRHPRPPRARHRRRLLPGRRRQPPTASFTGLARFTVKHGTGSLRHAPRQRPRHLLRGRRRPRPHDPHRRHPPIAPAATMTPAHNKTLVRRLIEDVIPTGDPAGWKPGFAPA